jgi:hypothetical protein
MRGEAYGTGDDRGKDSRPLGRRQLDPSRFLVRPGFWSAGIREIFLCRQLRQLGYR